MLTICEPEPSSPSNKSRRSQAPSHRLPPSRLLSEHWKDWRNVHRRCALVTCRVPVLCNTAFNLPAARAEALGMNDRWRRGTLDRFALVGHSQSQEGMRSIQPKASLGLNSLFDGPQDRSLAPWKDAQAERLIGIQVTFRSGFGNQQLPAG